MAKYYAMLAAAIMAEVIATTALSRSSGFTKLAPTLTALVGYVFAFWLLSIISKVMPMGIIYAIWSGMGIVLIAAVGWSLFGQKLDGPAMFGVGLILAGVLVINLFSKTVGH